MPLKNHPHLEPSLATGAGQPPGRKPKKRRLPQVLLRSRMRKCPFGLWGDRGEMAEKYRFFCCISYSPGNQWLEDVFPTKIVLFFGDMLVFRGVRLGSFFPTLHGGWVSEASTARVDAKDYKSTLFDDLCVCSSNFELLIWSWKDPEPCRECRPWQLLCSWVTTWRIMSLNICVVW